MTEQLMIAQIEYLPLVVEIEVGLAYGALPLLAHTQLDVELEMLDELLLERLARRSIHLVLSVDHERLLAIVPEHVCAHGPGSLIGQAEELNEIEQAASLAFQN
jgi:hypothetical protein